MPKHKLYRGAKYVGRKTLEAGEGALALATSAGTFLEESASAAYQSKTASKLGHGARFVRNVIADTGERVPLLGTLLDAFVRHKDIGRLEDVSPEKIEAKLNEYGESYNLSRFTELADKAASDIHNSTAELLGQTERLDISEIESLNKGLSASTLAPPARARAIGVINQELSACIPKTKLGDAQQKFKDIKRAIEKSDNPTDAALTVDNGLTPINKPKQAADAFKSVCDITLAELKQERQEALDELNKRFIDTPATTEPSDFKKSLANLFGFNGNDDNGAEVDAFIAPYKQHLVKHVTENYQTAENKLKEKIEDKPATKDKEGKEIPGELGILSRAKVFATASKADLLSRIEIFEDLLEKDPSVALPKQGLVSTSGALGLKDPAFKKRFLKDKSREDLLNTEISGWLYGKRVLGNRTGDGTQINVNKNGNDIEAEFKVPGLWFPYHKATPQQMFKDMLSITNLILAEGKTPPAIKWKIDAKTDALRNKMVVAACLAAHAKSIDPKNVTLAVSGSQEKEGNFADKKANDPEVMRILQGSGDEKVKRMLDDWKKRAEEIENKTPSQEFIKGGVKALRQQKTVAEELSKPNPSATTPRQ